MAATIDFKEHFSSPRVRLLYFPTLSLFLFTARESTRFPASFLPHRASERP
jgi:hypothetical protein